MGGRKKGEGGKGFVEFDWQVAYNIAYCNGIESYVENPENNQEEGKTGFSYKGSVIFSSKNQERDFIKKDLIQNLSKEAKDIIFLILKSPAEILKDLMPPKYKGTTSEAGEIFSKELIRKKLRNEGWKNQKIEKAFQELRTLIKELETA